MKQKFIILSAFLLVAFGANAQRLDIKRAKQEKQTSVVTETTDLTRAPKIVWKNNLKTAEDLEAFTIVNGGDDKTFKFSAKYTHGEGGGSVIIEADLSEAHDDWLILPKMAVPVVGILEFEFYAKSAIAAEFGLETFDLAIATVDASVEEAPEPAAFSTVLMKDVKLSADWKRIACNLNEYKGKNVFLAIHSTTLNKWKLVLDDFAFLKFKANDLALDNIIKSNLVKKDEPVNIKAVVKNLGATQVDSVEVTFVVKNKTNEIVLNEKVKKKDLALTNGATVKVATTFTPTALGDYTVEATVVNANTGVTEGTNEIKDNTLVAEYPTTVIESLENLAVGFNTYADDDGAYPKEDVYVAFDPETAFKLDAPSKIYTLSQVIDYEVISGDVVNGVYYNVVSEKNADRLRLAKVGLYSGEIEEELGDIMDAETGTKAIFVSDVAYNYNNKTMYAIGRLGNKLYKIDLETAKATLVRKYEDARFRTLACNLNGELFTISVDNHYLYKLNAKGDTSSVGNVMVSEIKYSQSMTFNHKTGVLYWAHCADSNAQMFKVNTSSGKAESLGLLTNAMEVLALTYDFEQIVTTVTINVKDGDDGAVAGAEVIINGETQITNDEGKVVFELGQNNTYNYEVRKENFANKTGNFTVAEEETKDVDIVLATGNAEYYVNFFVVDKDTKKGVAEATVKLGELDALKTDASGYVTFKHPVSNDVTYTIQKQHYVGAEEKIAIEAKDMSITDTLEIEKYDLKIVVSEGSTKLEKAVVKLIKENEVLSSDTTDENGAVSIKELKLADYSFSINYPGLRTVFKTITVDKDKEEAITLEKATVAPEGLAVKVNFDEKTVELTWDSIPGFFDDFENYEPFAIKFSPWTLRDEDKATTWGAQDAKWPNMNAKLAGIIFNQDTVPTFPAAHSGKQVVASFGPAESPYKSDDWIISPKIRVEKGDRISFFAAPTLSGDFSLEEFSVHLSILGTNVEDFVEPVSKDILTTNGTEWTEYEFTIPEAFLNREIYVGIHVTSRDKFALRIDDFKVGSPLGEGAEITKTYTVQLDGKEEAKNLTEAKYMFTELEEGKKYTAGVSAVYESGATEFSTIEFEVKKVSAVENTIANIISITPNPTCDIMKINAEGKYNVQVVDMLGRVIINTNMTNSLDIDMTSQEAGMYFVVMSNKDGVSKFKVMKK